MLNEENIFLNVDANDKNAVLLFIAEKAKELNITKNEEKLLEDLKRRENEFSTGLQDGFAIPHARSDYVNKPSILYLMTNNGIEWGTMDDQKVQCIFSLLVPRKSTENIHLQMLSKLATCLIEDDFKECVKGLKNKKELTKYIHQKMEEQ